MKWSYAQNINIAFAVQLVNGVSACNSSQSDMADLVVPYVQTDASNA